MTARRSLIIAIALAIPGAAALILLGYFPEEVWLVFFAVMFLVSAVVFGFNALMIRMHFRRL